MITSCSPGWVNYAEYNYGDLLPHLSSCKSPHQMFGAILKSYYCEKNGIALDEVVFVGDDYGPGGNDESVYLSPIRFVKVDDYRTFPEVMKAEGLL